MAKTPKAKKTAKAKQKKRGIASSYTKAVADKICERLSIGEPLAVICRDIGVGYRTVYDWMDANKEFAANIARARDSGYDHIADDCMAIADCGINDKRIDDNGNEVIDNEAIQRSKLRVETRLKLLAKWSPKKYGDKQQIEHSGELNLAATLAERRKKAAEADEE